MKKNTLAALILTTLAAGQLTSLQAHAAGQLNVWEDIKKSAGIKTAVSDFEKQYNVKVNLQEMPYAQQLENLIAPDGSFPAIGRSITYRMGTFHLLADIALRHLLPQSISPASVRCAMTAVLHRCMDAPGTFDKNHFLTIGLCGHQPGLGEPYISTGSLYLCTSALLPLGLPESDPFWSGADEPWSGVKIWSGEDYPADHLRFPHI